MFPRLRGAWGPSRRVAFAVVPAAVGALLFLAGDRPSTGTARLEATQGTAPTAPTAPAPGGPATTAELPFAPAAEGPPATLGILDQAVAAAQASEGRAGAVAGEAAPGTTPPPSTTGPATSGSAASPQALSGDTAPAPTGVATSTTATTAPRASTTTTTAPPPAGPARVPAVEAEVVPLTNADRTANGLGPLSRNGCLDAAASRFAEQLAGSGVLAHHPGASAAVRDCRPNSAWGDNVGTSQPCSAGVLEEKWMASPSHRRNILTGEFRYIGVGAWTDAAGACWVQVLFSS